MSGSDYTRTPNYNLYKPVSNADVDVWGDHLNANADTLDSLIHSIQITAGVSAFNTRTGAVTLTSADVTTALTYTPYNVTNPAGYVTASGAATAAPVQSVATRTGAVVLTHTDITDWAATLASYAFLASPALTGNARDRHTKPRRQRYQHRHHGLRGGCGYRWRLYPPHGLHDGAGRRQG